MIDISDDDETPTLAATKRQAKSSHSSKETKRRAVIDVSDDDETSTPAVTKRQRRIVDSDSGVEDHVFK